MSSKHISYDNLKKVPDSAWDSLATKKIYFGHQSVGNNILDGVADIMKENPSIKLNIVEMNKRTDFQGGIFAHSRVGENTAPQSKVDAFINILEDGIGNEADAALLKFCYIDFNSHTDVGEVFEGYKLAIEDIKKRYPKLKVIHITVPLVRIQSGPKAWVKKIIARPIDGLDDNIKRVQYNDLLVRTFNVTDPIFDLSKIESTYPDGRRKSFSKDKKTYYAMVPAYTDDGGHLNEIGKKVIAQQFLLFLLNKLSL